MRQQRQGKAFKYLQDDDEELLNNSPEKTVNQINVTVVTRHINNVIRHDTRQ